MGGEIYIYKVGWAGRWVDLRGAGGRERRLKSMPKDMELVVYGRADESEGNEGRELEQDQSSMYEILRELTNIFKSSVFQGMLRYFSTVATCHRHSI